MSLEVSVCICTRNRPEELRLALNSIARSTVAPVQIVISDDGDDAGGLTQLLAEQELPISYVHGPRRGLGANRNNAVAAASGSHLIFLDDDALLGEDFLATVATALAALPATEAAKAIVTGVEINRGHTVKPNEQSLLGFQSRPYRDGEVMHTVVINASLFPRGVFEALGFDPSLSYGYDEVDLTTRAVAAGFTIVPCFEAANVHTPSLAGRGDYSSFANASRLYVTLKRRRWTERSPVRAWAGFALAGAHLLVASVKRRGLAGVGEARRTISQARDYYSRYLESGRLADRAAAG
jgi:glycosyltransferase involved in cell wall biosynthesis